MTTVRQRLLNYSTRIPAAQTASEIQAILVKHGAKAVLVEYSEGNAVALSFKVNLGSNSLGFRLPIEPGAVLRVLEKQHSTGKLRSHQRKPTKEQSVIVAWRIVKVWIEAQMAILESQMVTMEQVFLPYLLTSSDKTLYETMVERRFLIGPGEGGKQ